MDECVRVGILGTGFIAKHHYECIKRVFGVEINIVGVFDIIQEKCHEFANERGLASFSSLEEMLSRVDVVDICTPPYSHADDIIKVAGAGKHIMCEKPLLGYTPNEQKSSEFAGIRASKRPMLDQVMEKLKQINDVISTSGIKFVYLENFIYTPQIQKEAEILMKSNSKILRMMGEESHKGNHSPYSSTWKSSCGGSLISTGSHPIGAMLYLKRIEGMASGKGPIRPKTVSSRIHELTKIPSYKDEGFIRCDYIDVEDYAWIHIVFDDDTVGDAVTGATVLGGIRDYVDVFANNHTAKCIINPINLLEVYNPKASQFDDIYINYGITSKEGWLHVAPDENWLFGYQAEMQNAMECFASGRTSMSDIQLAIDSLNTIYHGYLSSEKLGREITIERIDG